MNHEPTLCLQNTWPPFLSSKPRVLNVCLVNPYLFFKAHLITSSGRSFQGTFEVTPKMYPQSIHLPPCPHLPIFSSSPHYHLSAPHYHLSPPLPPECTTLPPCLQPYPLESSLHIAARIKCFKYASVHIATIALRVKFTLRFNHGWCSPS